MIPTLRNIPRDWGCLLAISVISVALAACRLPAPSSSRAGVGSVEEGYFTGAGGVRLFYRKVGSATETAVYLHGGPWNMNDGGYELDELAIDRSLIAFDQRSGGRSDLLNDPAALTAAHYVQDLEALRHHFGLEQMILIGQSWGAGLAVQYATRHPTRVSRLLLLSPMAPSPNYRNDRRQKMNSVIGEEGVARLATVMEALSQASDDKVKELCREQHRLLFRAYLTDVSSLEKMKVGYCEASPEAIRHQYMAGPIAIASLGDYDFLSMIAELRVPVLVVEGADTYVPLEATRAWAATAHDGRLFLVPDANHLTWLEGDVPSLLLSLETFLSGTWPEGSEKVATSAEP